MSENKPIKMEYVYSVYEDYDPSADCCNSPRLMVTIIDETTYAAELNVGRLFRERGGYKEEGSGRRVWCACCGRNL